ncbi:hypothetical protein Holit_00487 [Hollandina sp. SP2]
MVINRVPDDLHPGDSRIKEITGYISDILHYTPKTFLVSNYQMEDDDYPLPPCPELWDYVQQSVTSDFNQKRLESSFNGYIFGLLEKCEGIIDKMMLELNTTKEEKEFLKKKIKDLQRTAIEIRSEIESTFKEVIDGIPYKFSRARDSIHDIVKSKIDGADKLHDIETTAYVNNHMLQFETKKQVDEIRFYIDTKLNELDRKVQDKLNTAYVQIQKKIELHFPIETSNMVNGVFKKLSGNVLEQSLLNYFNQFAGRGGTGIANGAKHLLKKLGDLFGQTFSRETHNKLAQILSKIGATSAKAVGVAVASVIEAITIIVNILTWQDKLKKAVDKGINVWYTEVVYLVINDLVNLKHENLQLLDQDISMYIEALTIEDNNLQVEDTEKLHSLLLDTKRALGDYNG